MGVQYTFQNHFSYYFIIGISFGCSHNLADVNGIEFVKTGATKKFIRTVIALIIMGLLLYLSEEVVSILDNYTIEAYLFKAFMGMFLPFFIMGPYTLFCQIIGLVQNEEDVGDLRASELMMLHHPTTVVNTI